jgi:hypothetical protein
LLAGLGLVRAHHDLLALHDEALAYGPPGALEDLLLFTLERPIILPPDEVSILDLGPDPDDQEAFQWAR